MDLIITLLAIYGGYRLWKWYGGLRQELPGGQQPGPRLNNDRDPDLIDIDYEEID